MEVGYARTSTVFQQEARQIVALEARGIAREHIFLDKLSGKNTDRPALQKLLNTVQSGDTVVVESVSRFARNTRDLLDLVEQLTAKGVEFISQKEHIDTTTPTGKFMLTVFAAVAELERDFIRQRAAEGIAAAKLRGVRFGRPGGTLSEEFCELVDRWQSKEITPAQAIALSGVSKSSFYRKAAYYRDNVA